MKIRYTKRIIFILLIGLTNSCHKTDSLDKNFETEFLNIVENYQKEVPIPDRKWIKEYTPFLDPKYCYYVSFEKNKKDTVFWIQLLSNGIYDTENKFGVYVDHGLKPTIIFDESNLSHKMLKKIKNEKLDTFVVNNGLINDAMYPHVFYKVKNKQIIFQQKFRGNME